MKQLQCSLFECSLLLIYLKLGRGGEYLRCAVRGWGIWAEKRFLHPSFIINSEMSSEPLGFNYFNSYFWHQPIICHVVIYNVVLFTIYPIK